MDSLHSCLTHAEILLREPPIPDLATNLGHHPQLRHEGKGVDVRAGRPDLDQRFLSYGVP